MPLIKTYQILKFCTYLILRLTFLISICYRAIGNYYPLNISKSIRLSSVGLDLSVTNAIWPYSLVVIVSTATHSEIYPNTVLKENECW